MLIPETGLTVYFVTFAVVGCADVFVRNIYKDILLDSIRHCQKEKGWVVYAGGIMISHVHAIISRNSTWVLEDIMRDVKKITAHKIIGELLWKIRRKAAKNGYWKCLKS